MLAKKKFCSKPQAGVFVKLFQRFEVESSLTVLNAGRCLICFGKAG